MLATTIESLQEVRTWQYLQSFSICLLQWKSPDCAGRGGWSRLIYELYRTPLAWPLARSLWPQPCWPRRDLPARRRHDQDVLQRRLIPPFADRLVFVLAPMIAFCSFLIALAIVPVTPTGAWQISILDPVFFRHGRFSGIRSVVCRLVE